MDGYPDEDPNAAEDPVADAVIMIGLTATAIQQHSRYGNDFEEVLERASAILCFIFKLAKPALYVERMTEARGRFRGIYRQTPLRNEFRERIDQAARDGHLRTLSAAIAADVWRYLLR